MNILIVDDHPVVRDGLRRLLSGERNVEIRESATAKEALAAFRQDRPDLTIVDLNLPGLGGLELTQRLILADKTVRILVFSMHADPIYAARSIEAGARGYVSKNAEPAEILEAVRRVAQGGHYIEQEIAQALALINVRGTPLHPLQDLSRRDLEILRLLGEGQSLAQIAAALGVSYKTIANACSQIKEKLGATRTADLIRIAIETSRGA